MLLGRVIEHIWDDGRKAARAVNNALQIEDELALLWACIPDREKEEMLERPTTLAPNTNMSPAEPHRSMEESPSPSISICSPQLSKEIVPLNM